MANKGTYKPEAEHQASEAETVSTWGNLTGALGPVREASHFLVKRQLWDLALRKVDGICSLHLFCSLPVCPKDLWDGFQSPWVNWAGAAYEPGDPGCSPLAKWHSPMFKITRASWGPGAWSVCMPQEERRRNWHGVRNRGHRRHGLPTRVKRGPVAGIQVSSHKTVEMEARRM